MLYFSLVSILKGFFPGEERWKMRTVVKKLQKIRVGIRLRGLRSIDIRCSTQSLEKLLSRFFLLFIRFWLFLRLVPLILEKP